MPGAAPLSAHPRPPSPLLSFPMASPSPDQAGATARFSEVVNPLLDSGTRVEVILGPLETNQWLAYCNAGERERREEGDERAPLAEGDVLACL